MMQIMANKRQIIIITSGPDLLNQIEDQRAMQVFFVKASPWLLMYLIMIGNQIIINVVHLIWLLFESFDVICSEKCALICDYLCFSMIICHNSYVIDWWLFDLNHCRHSCMIFLFDLMIICGMLPIPKQASQQQALCRYQSRSSATGAQSLTKQAICSY